VSARNARERDRGTATVFACVGVVVLLLVTGVGVHLGSAVLARQRAETGADLAALAGAAVLLRGVAAACAAATQVARANQVELRSCAADGLDLLVEVSAEVAGGRGVGGSAIGRARAGPVQRAGVSG
jgi:secretion/DNA translocation related TadE-like protein